MICAKEGEGAVALLKYLPERIYKTFSRLPLSILVKTEELRFCKAKPTVIVTDRECFYVTPCGELSRKSKDALTVGEGELEEMLRLFCEGSVYVAEDTVSRGYVTAGGHRVGICGTYWQNEKGQRGIKDISCLNVRVARQVIGSAEGIIEEIASDGIKNTLIISPPGGGKTTLLRDICRILGGDGYSYKVAIADERGELAASCNGKALNDVGARTCVMDGCLKAGAMEMLLRSMGPDVIVTDEIGNPADGEAICDIMRCGVKVIASAHGSSLDEVKSRMSFCLQGFERLIVLENKKIREVIRIGA